MRKPQRASAGRLVGKGSVGHVTGSNLGAGNADSALEAAAAVTLLSRATAAPTTITSTLRTAATKNPVFDVVVRMSRRLVAQ
jgi:predicted amidohydrolase